MHYTTITSWELRKMDWAKVRAETDGWKIIKWEITVEDKEVYILHNNPEEHGANAKDKKWYKYSWLLTFEFNENDEPTTEINRLETIEEFTEWELVYVSDYSIEESLKDQRKRIYLYTTKKWIHVTQREKEYEDSSSGWVYWRKYIAKIPKEETVEMTMEEINKALWKKVKIIE